MDTKNAMHRRVLPQRWLANAAVLTAVLAVGVSSSVATAAIDSYRVLDNVEGSQIDLFSSAVRPLAKADDGTLYALNVEDSTVRAFSGGTLLYEARLPLGPVAIAVVADELLVTSRGTHALVRVERSSGAVVGLLELPSEPADLLVNAGGTLAFVACSGADSVVQVDLATNTVQATYAVASKHPVFLSADGSDVLVAPQLSGNNTIADLQAVGLLDAGPRGVIDLEDPAIANAPLADSDLFRIDPAAQTIEPVVRAAGMVLFGHGVNPVTGDHWLLNTEGKNSSPFGEPLLRGDFIANRLSISTLAGVGTVVEPHTIVDLDDDDPIMAGVQFNRAISVGQPYNLAFSGNGDGFLTGLLSDNVTWTDSGGQRQSEWDLAAGCVPRGLLIEDAAGAPATAYVHCSNSNTVEVYDLTSATPLLTNTLSLGHDPTSPARIAGRTLFFDGKNSEHANASCASCHVNGATDMAVWYLGEPPFDDKGPLVTQTLIGLTGLEPFHWRGERSLLADFNGAFDDLLGGSELSTSDLDDFETFVFGLVNPANAHQDLRRVLNDQLDDVFHGSGLDPNAVAGQTVWFDLPSVGPLTCDQCHTAPTGSSTEIIRDEPAAAPKRKFFKVAPLTAGVWRKEQPTRETVTITDAGGMPQIVTLPTVGSGLAVTGQAAGIFAFAELATQANPLITQQNSLDLAAFVNQWDSGLAPCVHRGWLLDLANSPQVKPELNGYLRIQRSLLNCDVVVFGTVDFGGGPQSLRWFWDRRAGAFVAEDSTVGPRPLAFFETQADTGLGSNVFLGVPVGFAERFAVDFDEDDLYNIDEAAFGADPLDPDSDDDGFPDGHEVLNGGNPTDPTIVSNDTTPPTFTNLRIPIISQGSVKVLVHSSEPTQSLLSYQASGASNVQIARSAAFTRFHSIVLTDVEPETTYTATLDLIDHGGNGLVTPPTGPITTLSRLALGRQLVRDLDLKPPVGRALGAVSYRLEGTIEGIQGNPLAGLQIVAKTYVNGVLSQSCVVGTASGVDGKSQLTISESGLATGDVIRTVIEDLENAGPSSCDGSNSAAQWSLPDTLPEDREHSFTF